jgi:hypothetical protein
MLLADVKHSQVLLTRRNWTASLQLDSDHFVAINCLISTLVHDAYRGKIVKPQTLIILLAFHFIY